MEERRGRGLGEGGSEGRGCRGCTARGGCAPPPPLNIFTFPPELPSPHLLYRSLLYRSDRDYREAIECYLNALRIDKDNTQILRDLANLQVREGEGLGFRVRALKACVIRSLANLQGEGGGSLAQREQGSSLYI